MSLETFLLLLLTVSIFDGLFTEAVKMVLNSLKIEFASSNILAGIVSVFLSFLAYMWYMITAGFHFDSQSVIYLIALVLLSWLSAMVGYDKVVQAIIQITTKAKEG